MSGRRREIYLFHLRLRGARFKASQFPLLNKADLASRALLRFLSDAVSKRQNFMPLTVR